MTTGIFLSGNAKHKITGKHVATCIIAEGITKQTAIFRQTRDIEMDAKVLRMYWQKEVS